MNIFGEVPLLNVHKKMQITSFTEKHIQKWLLSHLNQCVEKLLKHITIIEIIIATIQHKLL